MLKSNHQLYDLIQVYVSNKTTCQSNHQSDSHFWFYGFKTAPSRFGEGALALGVVVSSLFQRLKEGGGS